VTDESASFTPANRNILNRTTIGGYNLSNQTVQDIIGLYPINASYTDPSGTGNFFQNGYDAVLQGANTGEGGGICSVIPWPLVVQNPCIVIDLSSPLSTGTTM
jgi:hypothetical protein